MLQKRKISRLLRGLVERLKDDLQYIPKPKRFEVATRSIPYILHSVYKKEVILMTNSERYQKYIKEHCKNCKNRTSNLCDIRIAVKNDVIETKCVFYERNREEC